MATVEAIVVASADPAMPNAGIGPQPPISSGLSATSSTTEMIIMRNGVRASPAPRIDIDRITLIICAGMAMKITRK